MALPPLHFRLPLEWAELPAAPAKTGERPRLTAYMEAIKGGPDSQRFGPEGPDPVGLASLTHVPAAMRLRLLDRLYAAFRPDDAQHIDRFIDAYLSLAVRGFSVFPLPSLGRRCLAHACACALELMGLLFREQWQRRRPPPSEWWGRFLATFRAADTARLFAVRTTALEAQGSANPLRPVARTLLYATANPFSWETELQSHLDRFLDLLAEDVLLFPAASPSAYVESRRGRFVFDAAGERSPVLPDGLDSGEKTPGNRAPDWWIIDASRALTRLTELRRGLDLGASPERLHPLLAEIPEAPRRMLLQRLERTLGRTTRHRRSKLPEPRIVHVAVGLEQAVRHCFAGRWSGSRDPSALQANVRLQSEALAHPASTVSRQEWTALEWDEAGLRLQGGEGTGASLVGRPVLVMDLEEDGPEKPAFPRMQAGIFRWEQNLPGRGGSMAGVELLSGRLHDGWCRVSWRMGSSLQEQPVLLVTGPEGPASMLMPPGLFRSGAPFNIRIDNQDRLGEMIRLEESGVHFEHISVRLKNAPDTVS